MAVTPTSVTYDGNGSQTDFTFPFPYLDKAHVKVSLDGVATTAFTLVSTSTVRMTVAPGSGVAVRVYRETPTDPLVNWTDGAIILGADLNTARKHAQYIAEEARDTAEYRTLPLNDTEDGWDAGNKRISNVATPTETNDAAPKSFVENSMTSQVAQASASATSAAASAATATAQAASVSSSATTASTAASTATTKASEASASQAAAAASQSSASTSASTATTKATEAAASAAAAAASQSAAAASEAAAAASATSAASSAVSALTAFDGFDDRYLGQKTSDPTVDNDGNALLVGALYFNSVTEKMRTWSGVAWANAYNDSTSVASAITNDSGVSGASIANALNTLNSGKAATAHGHVIGDVTGLQTALDGKAASSHTHAEGDVTGLTSRLSTIETNVSNAAPPGTVAMYAGTVAPTGWYFCDGTAKNRTTDAALFAAIGTAWGAGNGTTTFNIPNTNGYFPRGLDNGRGIDTGRTLGSNQDDAFQGHVHNLKFYDNNSGFDANPDFRRIGDGSPYANTNEGSDITVPKTDGTNGTPRTAAETRPKNFAINFIIKR